MSTLKLEVDYRSDMKKSHLNQIRRNGYATGSVFGHSNDPVSVAVKMEDLIAQLKGSDAGMTSLIDLKIKGAPEGSDGMVIIKEFTKDHLSRKVLDIQFQRVYMKEKMHINVPVTLVGEAIGINEGGVVEQAVNELLINCFPNKIPSSIEVNIANLELGHHITIADLEQTEDYDILADSDTTLVTCVAPHIVVEEAPAEEESSEEEAEATTEEAAE